ncbi:MAG TPA: DEAD/DEAH box helicase [Polyangiaceae bacterium]|nr:DEAD/DEAH box helicase [Polyangiaceae bacterium]
MTQAAAFPGGPEPVHSIPLRTERWPFVPRLRLFTETLTVDRGDLLRTKLEDVTRSVVSLVFDYGDGACFRAAEAEDPFPGDFSDDEDGFSLDLDRDSAPSFPAPAALVDRDTRAEARAQTLLESFGAVELARLDDFLVSPKSQADYLVSLEDNVHSTCSFVAHAVPKLKEAGFEVTVDEAYPLHVTPPAGAWYARMDENDDGDWFSLEIGVEVDGERMNLLPALLEILESVPDDSSLSALRRLPAKYRAVRVGEGKYVPVPVDRLVALLEVLVDLYDGCPNAEQTQFRKEQALCLTALDGVLETEEPLTWTRGAARMQEVRAFRARPKEPEAAPPDTLQATLRPYQQEGLAFLQHLRRNGVGGVLADDMGLGKTLQTIAHLCVEKESGRMDVPSLIVMPTSLVTNWSREVKKFAPHLRVLPFVGPKRHRHEPFSSYDVVLTTYPVLIRDVEKLQEQPFHLVVLDEAQAIKNARSRAHQAVSELECRHRVCLSGTPVENNLGELWALFDFLSPGLLGTAEEFRSRFRTPIEKDENEERLQLLRKRVGPFVIRRTKEQVAKDLPPKTELVRPVEISGPELELYESIRVAAHAEVRGIIRKKGLVASTVAILDALMKLRQVCCHPKLVGVDRARSLQSSAKFDTLMEMLEEQLAEGRKVLVFSQFARMLALTSEALLARGIRHTMLTGATRDRQATVDAFQDGKVDVFLISLKAGGTGLNLTRADTVIHYEPWWNPAAQAQATDRAYRIGQKNPVFVHNLIVSGSVEERMLRLQERKRHLADSVLGNGSGGAQFSEEDLDDLFAPLGEE